MRVEVDVSSCNVDHPESNRMLPGLCLECTRCEHRVEVAGESRRSFRYGYMRLKDECPLGESNYYACEDEPEDDL